ncbi:hypothetical protein MRX96_010541 [Rhipicephalus microplus]
MGSASDVPRFCVLQVSMAALVTLLLPSLQEMEANVTVLHFIRKLQLCATRPPAPDPAKWLSSAPRHECSLRIRGACADARFTGREKS